MKLCVWGGDRMFCGPSPVGSCELPEDHSSTGAGVLHPPVRSHDRIYESQSTETSRTQIIPVI